MATFLLKTEPGDYSYADLVRDRRTTWTGVKNPAARAHMRSMAAGDEAFIYHTGKEKCIVGLAKIVNNPFEDPGEPGQTADGEIKAPLFHLEPVKQAAKPVTLAELKADERFEGFALVRQPRLSVMPVPPKLDKAIRKMAGL